MMTRREALKRTGMTAALCLAAPATTLMAQNAPAAEGPLKLPPLPYATDALEPHIDARTMEIHHGRHHAAYVANANKALAAHPDLAAKPLEQLLSNLETLPQAIQTTIRNNAGGHLNHALFWQMMKKGGGQPSGELAKALERDFGSLDAFKQKYADAALKVFGSAWAWLLIHDNRLVIESTPNQDTPVMKKVPERRLLLGLDVWEHAYYLKYQNRRADYIQAWFNVVNWDFVSERFLNAKS
jgi:Fe-Mn family superoxide dismutase